MICMVLGKYFTIHGHYMDLWVIGSDTQPDPWENFCFGGAMPCFDNLPETTLGMPHFALIKELISFATKRETISRLSIYDFRKWCQHMWQVCPAKQDGKMGPYLLRKKRRVLYSFVPCRCFDIVFNVVYYKEERLRHPRRRSRWTKVSAWSISKGLRTVCRPGPLPHGCTECFKLLFSFSRRSAVQRSPRTQVAFWWVMMEFSFGVHVEKQEELSRALGGGWRQVVEFLYPDI